MNTKHMAQEQISALADGELDGSQVDVALASLRDSERQADWAIYHQIGEVLRSDDMAVTLSPGFSARMSALLEQEPAIVAPTRPAVEQEHAVARRRWTLPGMAAAAAVAAVAFVTTPQLMVAMKGDTGAPGAEAVLVSAPVSEAPVIAAQVPSGVVLRDPRIDDYLLAHQRFSPSFYSTAQYARPATFANASDK